jgi:hypothetical protein
LALTTENSHTSDIDFYITGVYEKFVLAAYHATVEEHKNNERKKKSI